MPQVSIITPCYNSRRYIETTIESVRGQSLCDWEHIVVDDGSSDGSAQVVEKYLQLEPRLKLVRRQNGGVCRARNLGFEASSPASEYVLFLDADDCLRPNALALLVQHLDAHPQAGMVFCNYTHIDTQGHEMDANIVHRYVPTRMWLRSLKPSYAPTPLTSILCGAPILPSFSLLRRENYQRVGGWDEWLGQHHEDLDLFLRLALQSPVHFLDCRLGLYRRHPGQSTEGADTHALGSARLALQAHKFESKWSEGTHLNSGQKKRVQRARRFASRRVAPLGRLLAARTLCKQKRFHPALRLAVGALVRYVGLAQ